MRNEELGIQRTEGASGVEVEDGGGVLSFLEKGVLSISETPCFRLPRGPDPK